MRVSTNPLSNGGALALSSRLLVALHASYKDFPDGARTSFEACTNMGASEATAAGEKLSPSGPAVAAAPATDSSTFKYATSFLFKSSANCSPHSVDPVSAYSSPSQLQTTSVRRGRIPCSFISPIARVNSIIEAVPLEGSTPPKTHASR